MVVERHSKWEPTTKPYDTNWFAEPKLFRRGSGYNYARIYRYLGQYYEMSRLLEKDKIDDQTLAKCDVLIIKIPTDTLQPGRRRRRWLRFVEQGGGLLLIGDHTNFERSATAMNDIIASDGLHLPRRSVVRFRRLALRPVVRVRRPLPHPTVQHIPPMDFAVSCSIDPGHSRGRAVDRQHRALEHGPRIPQRQLPSRCRTTARKCATGRLSKPGRHGYGKGRAVAFTDSTVFSNFCVGQPGKSEVMLGMIEWLNHADPWLDPRPWFLLLGTRAAGCGNSGWR